MLRGANLIAGNWVTSGSVTFRAVNPATSIVLPTEFQIATPSQIDAALAAAAAAHLELRSMHGRKMAEFLGAVAAGLDDRAAELAEIANRETGLPVNPRFLKAEIPRASGQLRMFAERCRTGRTMGLEVTNAVPDKNPELRVKQNRLQRCSDRRNRLRRHVSRRTVASRLRTLLGRRTVFDSPLAAPAVPPGQTRYAYPLSKLKHGMRHRCPR